MYTNRVVLLPEQENASNTGKNAGISIREYANLCTDQIPLDLLSAKWCQVSLGSSKINSSLLLSNSTQEVALPLSTTVFKSCKEEWRESMRRENATFGNILHHIVSLTSKKVTFNKLDFPRF